MTALKKTTTKTTWSPKQTVTKQLHHASDELEAKIDHAAELIEDKMDEYASKITKSIDPKVNQKAHDVANKIDGVANKVEGVVNEIGSFIPNADESDADASTVSIEFTYTEKVSRLFIFRLLWLIIQWPIMYIRGIWFTIIWILQLLHMLVMGQRERSLWNKTTRYVRHATKRYGYILWMTDRLPKIIED